jgi:predicted oxidoreductase
MIWSPLAGGRLFNTADAQVERVRAVLEALGQRYGASLCTMAYAWILRHPSHPIPITGSRRIEGLQEAIAALQIELSTQDWYRVLEASTGQAVA